MMVLVNTAKSVIIKPGQKDSLLKSKESFYRESKRIQALSVNAKNKINKPEQTTTLIKNKECSHE